MSLFKFSNEPVMHCMDHTVSGHTFELKKDHHFQLLGTFPKPDNDKLPEYYKSENYISHTDSRKTIVDKSYQKVKSFMLGKKLSWIDEHKKLKGKILDIGAGTGDFLLEAKCRGWEVFGQEPNPAARELASLKGIALEKVSSKFPENSFDVITLWHVLEHVPNPESQITELNRLLKKDGILVIAVPNFKSYDARFYKKYWAAYDVPRHLFHFSRTSIEKLFSQFSFQLIREKGLWFDSFYVSLLSEKYKTGRVNFLKAFFIGLISNYKATTTGEFSSITYFLQKRRS